MSNKKLLKKNKSSVVSKLEDMTEDQPEYKLLKANINDFINNFKRHKSPKEKRPSKIKPKYVFIIIIAICVLLIFVSSLSANVSSPFKAIASAIIIPAQKGVNSVGLFFADKIETAKTIEEISETNKELENRVEELERLNSTLRNQTAELTRLQKLMELQEFYKDYPSVGATVIAKDSTKWFSTFTINKGYKDGIKPDMNVISGGGLVGIITDTGYNYSTVRAIIDDESSVSAQFQLTSELCIVNGNLKLFEQNLLEFSNVNMGVELEKDMAVVTSRISSKYLPGILIGYVSEYSTDANELTKSGYITPVVDFSNINEVLVITELKEDYISEEETETTTAAADT